MPTINAILRNIIGLRAAALALVAFAAALGCGDGSTLGGQGDADGELTGGGGAEIEIAAAIPCTTSGDCPGGYYCEMSLMRCEPGLQPPGDTDGGEDSTTADGDETGEGGETGETNEDNILPQDCDDGIICTVDTWNGAGCDHVPAAGSCLIDGVCRDAGDLAVNPCQACRPELSAASWSQVDEGTACNDGNLCTTADSCRGGLCEGDAKTCDDQVSCTDDICDNVDGSCRHTRNDASCGAGRYCDLTTGCTDGVCAAGETVCVSATEYRTCNADGTGWQSGPAACDPSNPICIEFAAGHCGQCTTPGFTDCDPTTGDPRKCNDSYRWDQLPPCSGDTPLCRDGDCVTCIEGESRCDPDDPNTVQRCSGGTWIADQVCVGPTPACQAAAGAAHCSTCTDGDRACGEVYQNGVAVSQRIVECVGGTWTVSQTCDNPTPVCTVLSGDPVCTVCLPDDARCDQGSHQVCRIDGSSAAWDCPTNPATSAPFPTCWRVDPCPDATPACWQGTGGGDAGCVLCLPGSMRCDPVSGGPQECTLQAVSGATIWTDLAPCPDAQPNCVAGECQACAENDTFCPADHPDHQSTCINNHWVEEACNPGEMCNPDSGVCEDVNSSIHFLDNPALDPALYPRIEVADREFQFDPNAPLTIEAWYYVDRLTGDCVTNGNVVASKWNNQTMGLWHMVFCSNNTYISRTNMARFGMQVSDVPNVSNFLNSPANAVSVGRWQHIAVTYGDGWTSTNNGMMRMFIDGKLVVSTTSVGWTQPTTYKQEYMVIGRLYNRGGWGFQGYIDEVRISKTIRYTGTAVGTQYFTPEQYLQDDPLTVGLWHLNEGGGTVCGDSATTWNNHPGTIINTEYVKWDAMGAGEAP